MRATLLHHASAKVPGFQGPVAASSEGKDVTAGHWPFRRQSAPPLFLLLQPIARRMACVAGKNGSEGHRKAQVDRDEGSPFLLNVLRRTIVAAGKGPNKP